jgi:cytochrome c
MYKYNLFFLIGLAGLAASLLAPAHVAQKSPAKKRILYRHVEPIFKNICAQCHKGTRPPHGLDLTSYERLMAGDRAGKVVVAGNPAKSRLITVLHGKPQLMPPGGDLTRSQIEKLEAWVKSGAKQK